MAAPPSLPSFSLIFHLRGYSKQIVEFLIARAQLSILIPLISHSFWDYIHEEEENSLTVSSSISFQINIFRNIYFQIHLFKLAHDFLLPQFLSKSTRNPLHINIANYAKRRERCTFYTYPKQRTILFLSSNSSVRPSDRNRSILLRRRNDCSVPLVVKRTCKCYMMLQKKKRKNSENKRAFVYRAKYCGSRVCWVEERGNLDGFVGRSGPLSPHFRRFDFSRAFDVPPTDGRKINHSPVLRNPAGINSISPNIIYYVATNNGSRRMEYLIGEKNIVGSSFHSRRNYFVFRRYDRDISLILLRHDRFFLKVD